MTASHAPGSSAHNNPKTDLRDPRQAGPGRGNHPPGLYLLFVTEMWERFSFYGMKAFLILYMTLAVTLGGLDWEVETAGRVYGWYAGLVYLTPVIGGWLADRWLGTHRSMLIGGAVIALGHFTLAGMDLAVHGSYAHYAIFIAGLALVVLGTGLFKPCVSVMVGQLYRQGDPRRDAAFTIFYMGINLGAFLGPLVCGALRYSQQTPDGVFGWSWAFGAAGVGMVAGLIAYVIGRPFLLKGIGLPPSQESRSAEETIDEDTYCPQCGYNLRGLPARDQRCPECGAPVRYVPPRQRPLTWQDKQRVAVIFIMSFFVIFFWTAFEQAGLSMNLFAEHRTDRSIPVGLAESLHRFASDPAYGVAWWLLAVLGAALLGGWYLLNVSPGGPGRRIRAVGTLARVFGLAVGIVLLVVGVLKRIGALTKFFPESMVANPEYPTEWFQSVNSMFILLLAPLFATVWMWLGRAGREPSAPVKFALGLILLGVGFLFMVFGAQESQQGGDVIRVSGSYLLAAYCLHTMGELCLSPVGLSLITKLAPLKLVSALMGVWFLANFVSNLLAGYLTAYSEAIAEANFILPGLSGYFLLFVIAPIGAGLVLLMLAPMLNRMMHGRG